MITDANSCTEMTSYAVENRIPKAQIGTVTIKESCIGQATGSIAVTTTGGLNPTVRILTVPGNSQIAATNLAGNRNYMIEVADQGNVCDQRTIFLGEYGQMVVSGTVTDDTDNGNGSITVNVTNTVGALMYDWDPTNSGRTISGLRGGTTHSVTVTDATTGCSASEIFNIEDQRPVQIDEPRTAIIHAKCPGGADGSFTIEFSQAVHPLIVSISGVAGNTTIGANPGDLFFTQTNLNAGTYVVNVRDANNRTAETTIVINEPNAFSASAKVTPRTDAASGSIDLTVTGGTQPYTFKWSDNQTSEDPINLSNGTYNCTVTDANGCTFTTPSFTVSYFRITGETVKDSDCAASANGSISVNIEGGNQPYNYSWTGPNNFSASSDQISNLTPGNYTVVVTDDFGTTISESYTITTQSTISAFADVEMDASCFGGSDGEANVTAVNGQAPYTYLWDSGDNRTSQQVAGLAAGTANVVVTDALGCQATASVSVSEGEPISVNADVTDILCYGDKTGEIMVNVSGGSPNGSIPRYNVFWDDANLEGQRIRNLGVGSYTAMIEDKLGCEEEVTITVEGPTEKLMATIETADDLDGNCSGTARAEVTGGTAPYFYHWSTEADTIDRELTGLCSGDYSLSVTDANGCTAKIVMGTIINRGIPCLSTRAVMTPDGEGRNEEFIIYCIEDYPDNSLEIYNRWGQLVWEQDNYDNTWSGKTLRGNDVPDGAYFFVFRYNQAGSIQQQKGSFSLLRQ